MKVMLFVSLGEKEVEVTIGVDEIAAALAEASSDAIDEDRPFVISGLLNTVAQVLKAVTAEQIAGMSDDSRKIIGEFLAKQSARFAATAPAP